MKVLPYPQQAKLEQVLEGHLIHQPEDAFPEDEFRQALIEVFKRTPPTVGQLYETQRPLILEITRLREKMEIEVSPYIKAMTLTYVQTLKECLKDNRLGTRPSRTSTPSASPAPIVSPNIPEGKEPIQKNH